MQVNLQHTDNRINSGEQLDKHEADEFLASVWGADSTGALTGVHFIAELTRSKDMRHHPVKTLTEAVAKAQAISNAGHDAYFACSEYLTPDNRKGENVGKTRAFWLDIDCGEAKAAKGDGYPTKSEARDALMNLCRESGLPEPNALVDSGNGLHVHWVFDADVPCDQWRAHSRVLKALTKKYGLLADPSRTADIASVLRVPGTKNWKDPNNPKPVKIQFMGSVNPWVEFKAALDKASSELAAVTSPVSGNLGDLKGGVPNGFELPDIIKGGERNSTLLRYAGHLRGHGIAQNLIEQFMRDANLARCKPPLDDHEVIDIAGRYAKVKAQDGADDWPEPKPVEFGLPEAPAFDPEMLPEAFREFVMDEAERMQSPPDYLAIPLMVSAAAALGNGIAIAPKAQDTGWLVAPTLWGGIVGRPGTLKSPAMNASQRPLTLLESELSEGFAEKQRGHAVAKAQYEAQKARVEKTIRQGQTVRPEDMPIAPEEPQPERLVVNDTTVPKLGEILRWSPRGVLVVRDELVGLLESLNADGREGDRSFYLEGWNGLHSYRFDRIGRGSFIIPRLNVLLLGGIQPGKLQAYVRQAVQGGGGDDGLLQRFQLIVWPDPVKEWHNVDRQPNFRAQERVYEAIKRLRRIDPIAVGANLPEIGSGAAWLHFSTEAQRWFDAWRQKLENSLRRGDRHPALESHLAKYRSLVPALALVIHLADGGLGPVDVQAVRKAINWAQYLHKHAQRVYASVTNAAGFSAKALADKISKGKLSDGFTLRDVYRQGWQHISTLDDARAAVEWLVDAGWLRPERTQSGGRPGECYRINPRVNKLAGGGRDAG